MLDEFVKAIASSSVREHVLWALSNVPGLPPIAQAIHILGIGVVVATAVMIALRFLNLAVRGQSPTEMIQRLMPWLWWALLVMLMTGILFVIARPQRYFYNPIAVWKFFMATGAIGFALVLHAMNWRESGFWEATRWRLITARVISVASLGLWLGTIFAGRWIAYSDYLIDP